MRIARPRIVASVLAVCVLAAAVIVLLWSRARPRAHVAEAAPTPVEAPPPGPTPEPAVSVMPTSSPVPAPLAPPPPTDDVALVFTAGSDTYVVLGEDSYAFPSHGRPQLVDDADATVAVARVAPRDVPSPVRQMVGKGLEVDGDCTARVTGYAIVARLQGIPRDVQVMKDSWTASDVMDRGRVVFAARIEGCSGTFARPVGHPSIEVLSDDYDAITDVARERFVTSQPVMDIDREWREGGNDGAWYQGDGGELDVRIFEHPRTHVSWVMAHAYRFGDCGQIGGNVTTLYRVEHGTLVEVSSHASGADHVTQLIDIDRDGQPELVSTSTLASSIERADGTDVTSLGVPRLGCGC